MSGSSTAVPPIAVLEKQFYWCLAIACVAAAVLLITVPPRYLAVVLVSGACVALGVLSFLKPSRLIYFVLVISPITGLVQSLGTIQVDSTDVTVSGVLWVFIAIEALAVMWSRRKLVSLPREFHLLLGFTGWVIVRWLLDPSLLGLKDVLFYGFPLLMGIYSSMTILHLDARAPQKIEKIILWSPWAALAYFAVTIPTGIVTFNEGAPRGPIDPRSLASYLLVVAACGFAAWKYDPTIAGAKRGRMASFVATFLIIFTLSRAATLIALLLFGMSRINRQKPRKAMLNLAASGVVAALVFAAVPQLGSRVFLDAPPASSNANWTDEINTEGRAVFWATTLEHAIERPLVGWGLGSARLLVADVFPGGEWNEYHPHNEYLQVFHDLGTVGLTLVMAAWFSLLYRFWKKWRRDDLSGNRNQAKGTLSSFLVLLAVLLSVLTGNEFHYAFVTVPAFAVVAVALCTSNVHRRYLR
jgi:hypothetical protein